MNKKVWRGYTVTETDTRVTMRPISTEQEAIRTVREYMP